MVLPRKLKFLSRQNTTWRAWPLASHVLDECSSSPLHWENV